ncbi:MAG: hypothetical protein CSB44_08340 [Gammaproteobacteria bacterium]|nr:MAG: hypothetical protein CSB44_08340 [Gammaproteobacteria bacterium]
MDSVTRRQSGFSMIELFMVLAIAAILLGLGLPSLRGMLAGSGVTAATNELVFSLQHARSEAVKRAGFVRFCPSANALAETPACSDGGDYADGWIVFADAAGNGSFDSGADTLLRQQGDLGGAITMTADAVFSNGVLFTGTGTSTNGAGVPLAGGVEVDYASGEQKRKVKIAANGRIDSEEVP